MDKYLQEYADKFEDNFPIYCCMGLDDEEIIKIIKECLKNNKPYEVQEIDGDY